MAAPDYTTWPTVADVLNRLNRAGITPRDQLNSDNIQTALDAVVTQLREETGRQFLPGVAGEVRYFDGSGTPLQDVDDCIAVTEVRILIVPLTAPGVVVTTASPRVRWGKPINEIEIMRGANLNYATVLFDHFPEGRSNIQVTGTWGFGSWDGGVTTPAAAIPKSIWNAACEEAAARLATESIFDPNGILVQGRQADVEKTWKLYLAKDGLHWTAQFCRIIKNNRKTGTNRLRHWKAPLL